MFSKTERGYWYFDAQMHGSISECTPQALISTNTDTRSDANGVRNITLARSDMAFMAINYGLLPFDDLTVDKQARCFEGMILEGREKVRGKVTANQMIALLSSPMKPFGQTQMDRSRPMRTAPTTSSQKTRTVPCRFRQKWVSTLRWMAERPRWRVSPSFESKAATQT